MTSRIDVKPATTTVWHQAIRNMTAHFGAERNIATIHEGDADGFKLYLQSQKLSSVTVFKCLQIARMFFRGDAAKADADQSVCRGVIEGYESIASAL